MNWVSRRLARASRRFAYGESREPTVEECLRRHQMGDWGEIDDENRHRVEKALLKGADLPWVHCISQPATLPGRA